MRARVLWLIPVLCLLSSSIGWAGPMLDYHEAESAMEMGRYAEALELYTEALASSDVPTGIRARMYNRRGEAHKGLSQYADAIADYDTAIRLKPGYVSAFYNRAVALERSGQTDQALDQYTQTIRLITSGKGAGSMVIYEAGGGRVISHPEPGEDREEVLYGSLTKRGILYAKRGKYKLAMADFDEAVKLEPKNAQSYDNRGHLHLLAGDDRSAIDDYARAVQLNARNPNDFYNLGVAQYHVGDYRNAIAAWRRALALAPPEWEMRADAEDNIKRAQGMLKAN